ncbi:MAG TPA: YggS family pyridoxal phosphate-dependent enzyme [Aquabacterium sp.]|uniref:YggS family pyridoxal phosphate-dependent enzyme n=1 Tax=Aquabacterium sp. TaxID=1872578 RepID=UPI002E35D543|nr:YggS family pyridoxal phosphate-dependent enzyme [Aquabacterium sp.]HEX5357470.1 YggS family pyridoxal phosphate-dependent enzyme [Aquabacterium sp.]
MATIANNLQLVRARINQACSRVGRAPDSVTLLAVSKTFPAETVREAFHAGQRKFGENYVQEAIDKIAALGDLRDQIEWHMIGPLQSNKTRVVAEHFDWVHTVDRLKIAQRLSEQRPAHLPPLQVCIQVNTSGEASKSGAAPGEALELAQAVMNLPRLTLRGVMALPAPTTDPALQKAELREVRVVFDTLRSHGIPLDTLSMGMSGDMEAAVEEGSSMLRVGTALFGNR